MHEEESYFQGELTRDRITSETIWGKDTLYKPGWIYQQILKLGAAEAIPELSDWYLVWDSDMLPVDPWPILRSKKVSFTTTYLLYVIHCVIYRGLRHEVGAKISTFLS